MASLISYSIESIYKVLIGDTWKWVKTWDIATKTLIVVNTEREAGLFYETAYFDETESDTQISLKLNQQCENFRKSIEALQEIIYCQKITGRVEKVLGPPVWKNKNLNKDVENAIISWDTVKFAISFNVYISKIAAMSSDNYVYNTTSLSFKIPDLFNIPSQRLFIWVEAINDNGKAFSNYLIFTFSPSIPVISIDNINFDSFKIIWDENPDYNYNIFYNTDNSDNGKQVLGHSPFTLSNLNFSTNYFVWLSMAKDDSIIKTNKTSVITKKPQDLKLQDFSYNSITVSDIITIPGYNTKLCWGRNNITAEDYLNITTETSVKVICEQYVKYYFWEEISFKTYTYKTNIIEGFTKNIQSPIIANPRITNPTQYDKLVCEVELDWNGKNTELNAFISNIELFYGFSRSPDYNEVISFNKTIRHAKLTGLLCNLSYYVFLRYNLTDGTSILTEPTLVQMPATIYPPVPPPAEPKEKVIWESVTASGSPSTNKLMFKFSKDIGQLNWTDTSLASISMGGDLLFTCLSTSVNNNISTFNVRTNVQQEAKGTESTLQIMISIQDPNFQYEIIDPTSPYGESIPVKTVKFFM
jgi:hypothetical protein